MRVELERAFGRFAVRWQTYPDPLPMDIFVWYVYLPDSGHSIACTLKALPVDRHQTEWLVPVPVKTVLRTGYTIRDGYVVVDLPYDPELGLVTPEEDDEF